MGNTTQSSWQDSNSHVSARRFLVSHQLCPDKDPLSSQIKGQIGWHRAQKEILWCSRWFLILWYVSVLLQSYLDNTQHYFAQEKEPQNWRQPNSNSRSYSPKSPISQPDSFPLLQSFQISAPVWAVYFLLSFMCHSWWGCKVSYKVNAPDGLTPQADLQNIASPPLFRQAPMVWNWRGPSSKPPHAFM